MTDMKKLQHKKKLQTIAELSTVLGYYIFIFVW